VRVVWIASAVFAVVLAALGAVRYLAYHSGADLGVFVQSMVSGVSLPNRPEGGSHFVHHFSPLLYAVVPLLRAVRSPLALVALQACAGALVAPAIFLIARKRMDHDLATLVALTTLVYPPLVGVVFTDFHENGFAMAAAAWLVWAVDSRRWALAALFAALALGIKEDQAFILGVLGLLFAAYSLRKADRTGALFGAGVAAVSIVTAVAYFAWIRPMAGGTGAWFALDYYRAVHPDTAIGFAAVYGRLSYILEAFGPLLFLPWGTRWIALALPGFIEVLSPKWTITYTMGQHYAAVWIPYVLIAFAIAVATIASARPALARNLVLTCIAICIIVLAVASPTHWGHYLRARSAHDASLDRVIALVPAGADVASSDEVYAHMSLNPNARIGMDVTPDYFVYDSSYDGATWRESIKPRLEAVVCTGYFAPVAVDDGVTLFKRVKDVPPDVFDKARSAPPTCTL
jgi:uncharacterized membrane protein